MSMPEKFIKMYQFELVNGVQESDFMAENAKMDEFLKEFEGFLYRSVARQEGGIWQDIVYFDSRETADKVDKKFFDTPSAAVFMKMIDESTVSVTVSDIVSSSMTYEPEAA